MFKGAHVRYNTRGTHACARTTHMDAMKVEVMAASGLEDFLGERGASGRRRRQDGLFDRTKEEDEE